MTSVEPFTTVLNLTSGHLEPELEVTERRLSDMGGMYLDERRADGDPLIYRVYGIPVHGHDGKRPQLDVVIEPGTIRPWFCVTKGHFHEIRDRAEIYVGLAGEGRLLLATEDGEHAVEAMRPRDGELRPGWVGTPQRQRRRRASSSSLQRTSAIRGTTTRLSKTRASRSSSSRVTAVARDRREPPTTVGALGRVPVFVGCDLGTMGTKAAVVNKDGRILGDHFEEVPLRSPRPPAASSKTSGEIEASAHRTIRAASRRFGRTADIAEIESLRADVWHRLDR